MALDTIQPVVAPKAPDDGKQKKRGETLKKASDGLNQGLGADGVVQDSTRAASLVLQKAGLGAKAVRVVADFTNGEGGAIDRFVRSTSKGMHDATAKVAPKVAPKAAPRLLGTVDRTIAPTLGSAARIFGVVSRWAQVAALPFAAFDVRDAIRAKDPKEKRSAIANAVFSVGGGIAGAVGGFMYASPIGLPLLIISTTTGVFQLLDHFAWNGKGMVFLGEHVVKPIENLFHKR